jgi:hypothetical protein
MNTIIEIPKPKILEREKIIYNPRIERRGFTDAKLKIMRLEKEEEFTRIDFAYYPDEKYVNGGWVQMQPDAFLRPCGSSDRFTLVKALNIPLAPNKHHFTSTKEALYYTLYFPGLPKGTSSIDIIEKEAPGTYFNFYGVSMEKVRMETLRVGN